MFQSLLSLPKFSAAQNWHKEPPVILMKQKDFPDLPATSSDGKFTASAWSPFTASPRTIEIVVLAHGYRTERFKLLANQVEFERDNTVIKLPELKVATYEALNVP